MCLVSEFGACCFFFLLLVIPTSCNPILRVVSFFFFLRFHLQSVTKSSSQEEHFVFLSFFIFLSSPESDDVACKEVFCVIFCTTNRAKPRTIQTDAKVAKNFFSFQVTKQRQKDPTRNSSLSLRSLGQLASSLSKLELRAIAQFAMGVC